MTEKSANSKEKDAVSKDDLLAGTEPARIFSISNLVCLSTSAAPRAASAFMFNVRNLVNN